MSKKYKNKSLSERVSENLNPHLNDSDNTSEDEETPKVTHFDEDDYNLGQDESIKSLSEIRKRNVKLLSEQSNKYSGVIASRKNYDMSDIDDDDDSQTSAAEDSEIFKHDPNDSEKDDSEEEDSDADQISNEDGDYSTNEDEEPADTELVSTKNNKLEAEKGICVQNQLSIWEKLLEIRIHSQKMLNKANSLPDPNDFNKISSNKEFKDTTQDVKKNAEILLEKLIETQVTLANQFSEIKKLGLSSRKRTNSRSSGEGTDYSSKKFAPSIEENFEKFRPYRNTVLLKWEDRTKLLAPSSGKQRKQLTEEFDIVKKVDNILMKRDDHIAKSQKLKGTYKLFGQNETIDTADGKADEIDVSSPHIYDDTDFYHSQLRELIEFKSNVSSDAFDVTKQFAELQKLRQKMKKKVDTRASKGRKIRYVVHNKLVNFMAPNDTTDWTDESKNELYRSLFVT